jgi:Xaa-Pro aminopeptidase
MSTTGAPAVTQTSVAVGTMASPIGARVEFARLRAERRARLFTAMADHDLDVLVLGRPASVAYASGARQLWTAGSRPFGPACVVVAETGRTHLLSVDDDGVPPEVAHEDLFGLSWNPTNLVASLRAIPGLGGARRVGTDSLSPGFPRLVQALAPEAEVVDGSPALWAARAVKTPDELACITTATAIAEAAMSSMIDALQPGVSDRDLQAVYLERIALLGAPTPPTDGVAWAPARHGDIRLRQRMSEHRLAEGELVVLDPGAMFAGYEGGLGRTWLVGRAGPTPEQRGLAARCRGVLGAVVAACRAGATGADLRGAWTATGEPLPTIPIVHGLGLGAEPPLIAGNGIGDGAVLEAGTVLSVTAWVTAGEVGGFLERETVLVTDDGAHVLSRYGHGPAVEER